MEHRERLVAERSVITAKLHNELVTAGWLRLKVFDAVLATAVVPACWPGVFQLSSMPAQSRSPSLGSRLRRPDIGVESAA